MDGSQLTDEQQKLNQPPNGTNKRRWLFIVSVALLVIIPSGFHLLRWAYFHAVGMHMKSVTQSLAEWAEEYSKIENDRDVGVAVGIMEYIENYYVPIDGYQSHPGIENALEDQRERTLKKIAASLNEYTGQSLGATSEEWMKWLDERTSHGNGVVPRE